MRMELARKNLSELGHQAMVDKVSTVVTNHGRPFFAICPPETAAAVKPVVAALQLRRLEEQLQAAITAGNDDGLAQVADRVEQAGLPLLAIGLRGRTTAELRDLLDTGTDQPG